MEKVEIYLELYSQCLRGFLAKKTFSWLRGFLQVSLSLISVDMADKWDPVAGENYGWVVMVVLLGYLLNFAQMIWLRIRRGRDSVSPPAMYAEDKPMFNGAQRAHQNTLEQLPYFLTSLLLAGPDGDR